LVYFNQRFGIFGPCAPGMPDQLLCGFSATAFCNICGIVT